MKGPWDDDEKEEFPKIYPPYATGAYCENPDDIVEDQGILIATVDQEVYEAWNRGE